MFAPSGISTRENYAEPENVALYSENAAKSWHSENAAESWHSENGAWSWNSEHVAGSWNYQDDPQPPHSENMAWSRRSETDSCVGASDDSWSVAPLGQGYLLVQSRLRVTRDGGHSILAVDDPKNTTRLGRVSGHEKAEETEVPRTHASVGGTFAPADMVAEAAVPPDYSPDVYYQGSGGCSGRSNGIRARRVSV